jgi:hypothetical protein
MFDWVGTTRMKTNFRKEIVRSGTSRLCLRFGQKIGLHSWRRESDLIQVPCKLPPPLPLGLADEVLQEPKLILNLSFVLFIFRPFSLSSPLSFFSLSFFLSTLLSLPISLSPSFSFLVFFLSLALPFLFVYFLFTLSRFLSALIFSFPLRQICNPPQRTAVDMYPSLEANFGLYKPKCTKTRVIFWGFHIFRPREKHRSGPFRTQIINLI